MDSSDHLARHQLADLFIDTVPYNAHTTASDALWTGLPVLSLLGDTFAGRVAGSLLNAIGLNELITNTQNEYETLAIDLGNNKDKLKSIKQKLISNKLTTPLFDIEIYARNIEKAYQVMHQKHRDKQAPQSFAV
jgi:predicted O-linked N-acetylglucosamine transferase (SPINDLY family)